jgi:hypothetical protein
MGKATLRTKSIGTKVSDDEYAQMEAQASARELTLSEWCREVLLAATNGKQPEPNGADVLAEMQALRAIVLNLFYTVLRGEAITEERMEGIIRWADEHKLSAKAQVREQEGAEQ